MIIDQSCCLLHISGPDKRFELFPSNFERGLCILLDEGFWRKRETLVSLREGSREKSKQSSLIRKETQGFIHWFSSMVRLIHSFDQNILSFENISDISDSKP